MKGKSKIVLFSVVLLAGLGCTATAVSAQTRTLANPLIPSRVKLILGTESGFDALVNKHLPDVAASPHYPSMKATSVLISNETPFAVRAIALRWTITQADGTERSSYSCICPEPAGNALLPGRRAALLPSHIALASPRGHSEEGAVAGHAANASLLESAFAKMPADPASDVLSAQKISVTIDAIVFGSGMVRGPDTFGLQQKLACERNGAVEEAQALAPFLGNSSALTQKLTDDAATADTAYLGGCAMARAREARRLLDLQADRGAEAVGAAIQQLSHAPAHSLHRVR
jgi:hypothetical protein